MADIRDKYPPEMRVLGAKIGDKNSPSLVWFRDPDEAYRNPYDYCAQRQFSVEAGQALAWLEQLINPRVLRFENAEHSLAKALWMLRTDSLDSLLEALNLINEKRHRAAGRLFRDALESMDLAYAFCTDGGFASKWLPRWYDNESPPHGAVRKCLERSKGRAEAVSRYAYYNQLSKFTHRTYRALLKSYSVGRGDLLVHDRWSPNNTLVLPHTIAAYYAILASLIRLFVSQLIDVGVLSSEDSDNMWSECLDSSHVTPHT